MRIRRLVIQPWRCPWEPGLKGPDAHSDRVSSGPQTVRMRFKNTLFQCVITNINQLPQLQVSAGRRRFSTSFNAFHNRDRLFRFNV